MYRSTEKRVVAGVLGGVAESWKCSPWIPRILFLLIFSWHPIGWLVYSVAWWQMPADRIGF